jgi:hypothetical protein
MAYEQLDEKSALPAVIALTVISCAIIAIYNRSWAGRQD